MPEQITTEQITETHWILRCGARIAHISRDAGRFFVATGALGYFASYAEALEAIATLWGVSL